MKTADKTWACSIQISALKDVFEVKFVVLSSPQVSIVNVHKALQITELEKKKKKNPLLNYERASVSWQSVGSEQGSERSQGNIGSTEAMILEARVP